MIETLREIMERLNAPDLTVAEAQDLQPRLLRLIETIEAESRRDIGGRPNEKAARDSQRCLVVQGRACLACSLHFGPANLTRPFPQVQISLR